MNKKGSMGLVLATITIIIFLGVFLRTLHPTFDEFRLDNLNSLDEHDNPNNPLMKLFWYAFHPIMWFFYIIGSLFALIFSTRAGADRI